MHPSTFKPSLLTLTSLLTSGVLSQNATTAQTTTDCACTQLSSGMPGSLFYPESENYTTINLKAWDVRSTLAPTCIFAPTVADDVAKGMGIISSCRSNFAIRGGGHMNYPGANSINDGVMLALGNLNTIQIAADNQTVEVGPGVRWFDVASYLEPYGRIVIGGRLKEIGVPGLTLIGGVHYFINKYGFAMDNVVSYDVVLGNGTQVLASAESEPDLFWALKGGANNFGVVTRFVLKTYDIPLVSTSIQTFDERAAEAFITATCELVKKVGENPELAAGSSITISKNATTKAITPSILAVQEGTESPASSFAAFDAIPGIPDPKSRINNVSSLAQFQSQLETGFQTFRVKFQHHTIKADAPTLIEFYHLWKDAVDEIADVQGLYPTMVFNIDPKSARSVAKNNGIGNVWGLDDCDDYIWYQTSTAWALEKDDLRVQTWSRKLMDQMHSIAKERGLATEFLYMGDAGEDQQVFNGMPVENVERMKEIRARYDVSGAFTELNWGGFKLPL